MKPTQILLKLCKDGKIDGPIYSHGRVTIGRKTFSLSNEEMEFYVHTKGTWKDRNAKIINTSIFEYMLHIL